MKRAREHNGPPCGFDELLGFLKTQGAANLANLIWIQAQQHDEIIRRLVFLKFGIATAKLGDVEMFRRTLDYALEWDKNFIKYPACNDYSLILTQSLEDLLVLRSAAVDWNTILRPELECFVLRAAQVSMDLEDNSSWWDSLQTFCNRLEIPVPDSP